MTQRILLYQIGIRCLVATQGAPHYQKTILYQIGIRCLVATQQPVKVIAIRLYQIGIRCLVATSIMSRPPQCLLYQIGIRCLVATDSIYGRFFNMHFLYALKTRRWNGLQFNYMQALNRLHLSSSRKISTFNIFLSAPDC